MQLVAFLVTGCCFFAKHSILLIAIPNNERREARKKKAVKVRKVVKVRGDEKYVNRPPEHEIGLDKLMIIK